MKTLRNDQAAAIDELRRAVRDGARRVCMQGATGYGKSIVAASIIESARAKGKRVLLTVPAISLIDQMVEMLWAQGIKEIGVIQANHMMTDWSQPVQVASVQTLARRSPLPQADVQIIDECHVNYAVIGRLLLAEDRRHIISIGMSATPYTKGLGKFYERLIVAGRTADLIERGILSPFRVFAPAHPDLQGVRTVAGDYHEGELAERMNKATLVADIVESWRKLGEDRPTICFAVNRAHADAISKQFIASAIPAGYMDCDTPLAERKALHRRLTSGDIKVVCNVDVIGMGVDWPEVACVIYARPTKSEMRFVQNLGRALRIAPGKKDAVFIDHSDTHLRLGFVTDIGYEDLDDGAEKPRAVASAPLPKECPQCHYLKPPRRAVCPNCGFKCEAHAKVDTVNGELAEIRSGRKGAAKKFPDKSATYGQLLWYSRSRGYKDGWAANKYRDLYGVWPRGMDGCAQYAPVPELASWIKSTQIRWAKSKRRLMTPEQIKARDEGYITKVREEAKRYVAGTLCTEDDLKEFGR